MSAERIIVSLVQVLVLLDACLGCRPDRAGVGRADRVSVVAQGHQLPGAAGRGLISVLSQAFTNRSIHAAGDAAYRGKPLLVAGATITTRLLANAALYAPAPACTYRRSRPRPKDISDRGSDSEQIVARYAHRAALVSTQGRHRIRRHARQIPQNPYRNTNYGRCRSSRPT